MEINYCLKKGKGKGNLYLPSFVVTLFCRRALMSLLCRRAFMSPRSYVAAHLCRTLFCRALFLRRTFVAIPNPSSTTTFLNNFRSQSINSFSNTFHSYNLRYLLVLSSSSLRINDSFYFTIKIL
jgi:hypothetical protein